MCVTPCWPARRCVAGSVVCRERLERFQPSQGQYQGWEQRSQRPGKRGPDRWMRRGQRRHSRSRLVPISSPWRLSIVCKIFIFIHKMCLSVSGLHPLKYWTAKLSKLISTNYLSLLTSWSRYHNEQQNVWPDLYFHLHVHVLLYVLFFKFQ